MPQSSIDRYFERFVRLGDMGALGEVFDATAPALYRIALHLRPCAAAAEDLVQSTFVTAIRKRTRFEPGRRVFPWLLGILTLHARDLHRRERNVSLRTEEVEESTPLHEIDRRETRECIEAAISGLPLLYREVVRRYLQDGTSPREISRQLCRSPDTVRSQLKRGLAQVRRGLPAGLRPAIGVLSMPERGLAGVRQRVLEQAGRVVGAASATSASSLAPLALFCSLLLASAITITIVVGSQPSARPDDLVASAVVGPRSAAPSAAPGPLQSRLRRGLTEEPVAGRLAELSGRAVHGESGVPIEDLLVELHDVRQVVRAALGGGECGALDSTRTDAAGRFHLRFPVAERSLGYRLQVAADEEHLVAQRFDWDHFGPGEHVSCGDVFVPSGARWTGRLLEVSGSPVARGSLRIECPGPVHVDVTDGEFVSPVLPNGRWRVAVLPSGLELLTPGVVEIRGPMPTRTTVTVARRPTIHGVVEDSSGEPVAGVRVRSPAVEGVSGVSDEQGRFHLFGRRATPSGSEVTLLASGRSIRPDAAAEVAQWNGPEVRIRVRRHPRVCLRVLDPSGGPVTDFTVRCVPATEVDGEVREAVPNAVSKPIPPLTRDGWGGAEVASAGLGWNVIHVHPGAPTLMPSGPIAVFVNDGPNAPVTVQLTESRRLRVTVVDEHGRAVPNARVELREGMVHGGGKALATATGARGVAEVRYRAAPPLALSVAGPGYARVERSLTEPVADLSVTLSRPGSLVGRFRSRTCARRVELRPVAGGGGTATLWVGAGGTFRGADLAPGVYRVVGLYAVQRTVPGRHDSRFVPFDAPLATVEIRAGEERQLTIDAPLARSAAVRGRLTFTGTGPGRSWIYIKRLASADSLEQGPFALDEEGRFELRDLAPGRYSVRWSDSGSSVRSCRLSIDLTTEMNLVGTRCAGFYEDIPCAPLDLRMVGADAQPLGDREIEIQWDGALARSWTDAAGRLRMPLAPLGRAVVRSTNADSDGSVELTLRPEAGHRSQTVTLPATSAVR